MTLKRSFVILFVLSAFCLAFSTISQADCTKKCDVYADALINFELIIDGNSANAVQKKGTLILAHYVAEGHYGGGCNTSVGRQKARKRACKAAKKMAIEALEGKPREWQNIICAKKDNSSGKYGITYKRNDSGYKRHFVEADKVKWIKIQRINFKVYAEDGTTNSVRKKGEHSIRTSGEKFACKNGKPMPVN